MKKLDRRPADRRALLAPRVISLPELAEVTGGDDRVDLAAAAIKSLGPRVG